MPPFPDGTATAFARSVSAEIRAVMAARRITGRELALAAGFKSHNYLAIRLRDEKAFTLDDIERICAYFDEDAHELIRRAHENHMERLMTEESEAELAADPAAGSGGFVAASLRSVTGGNDTPRQVPATQKRAARRNTGKPKLEED